MNGSVPAVSVLMPVYNTGKYLAESLRSIAAQTFRDFELIAIDDGSTDDSLEILRTFAAQDARVQVFSRPNRGVIQTRNELLGRARAELVAWADSDDIQLPKRLEIQLGYFAEHGEVVCLGTAAQCIDPAGRNLNVERYPIAHPEILLEQQKGGAMRFATTMMRRDAATGVGGFREPFRMGEDFDLLLRLSEVGEMANLPDVLYLYRQHLSSISRLLSGGWVEYRDVILALARERQNTGTDRLQRGESLTIEHVARKEDQRRLDHYHYAEWARYALDGRNFVLAREYLLNAIARWPFRMAPWKMLCRTVIRR